MEGGTFSKWVSLWLLTGLVGVLGQIVIGGVTRLTGSGLSITRWEIVTGTFPPMNEAEWEEAFQLYRETPQYALINKGMSLDSFKYIYFWEYFHRLWARLLGLVFLVPFLFFWSRGMLSRDLMRRLGILVLLAAITASFGWIMVASGLNERPWVNIYKLGAHLLLGFAVFVYLLDVWYRYRVVVQPVHDRGLYRLSGWIFLMLVLQVFLGGMVSGMKAGFAYPTWPSMNGSWIPGILLDPDAWQWDAFVRYDENTFMPAFVQFAHRIVAYGLLLVVLILCFRLMYSGSRRLKNWSLWLMGVVLIQVGLGILTVVSFQQGIPVLLASWHQTGGLVLLGSVYLVHMRELTPVSRQDVLKEKS